MKLNEINCIMKLIEKARMKLNTATAIEIIEQLFQGKSNDTSNTKRIKNFCNNYISKKSNIDELQMKLRS